MCIAEALREERDRLNLTQEGLGSLINYSSKTVSAVENGHRQLPDDAKMKLAQLSPRLALEICGTCPAVAGNTIFYLSLALCRAYFFCLKIIKNILDYL